MFAPVALSLLLFNEADSAPEVPDTSASAAVTQPSPDAPYVYAATDIRPRTTREIALCEEASHFDWKYTGAFAGAFLTSIYLNISPLKNNGSAPVRLLGPGLVGFTWGGLLSGGYLSLPKCDPLWAQGSAPEGNVRLTWPLATAISVVAAVTGPIMDYAFLGPVKLFWAVEERSARVAVAGGMALLGSLFPYVLPPSTWSARREIDKLRVEGTLGGAAVRYTTTF